ncbi:MAG: thermonuclease family protein [Patescibacteria group bacterium]|nr:thermonuclease family protein [Patescibacteria group bacterium]
MWSNSKLLAIASFLIVITGFSFLWFGLNQAPPVQPSPLPIPVVQNSPVASSSAQLGITGERIVVSRVVDGDTIELVDGKTVRFVGMDTPETVDPRRPVGCFGKEASNETKSLLSGKEVILQKDVSETDKYKRLLRYVFLPLENGQILFMNDYLVREGFAKVKAYPPDTKYNEQFKQAEKEARENNRGLWGKCGN